MLTGQTKPSAICLHSSAEFYSEYLFVSLLRVGCQQSGQLMRHFCMAFSQLKPTCEYKITILLLSNRITIPCHDAVSTVTDAVATAAIIIFIITEGCQAVRRVYH